MDDQSLIFELMPAFDLPASEKHHNRSSCETHAPLGVSLHRYAYTYLYVVVCFAYTKKILRFVYALPPSLLRDSLEVIDLQWRK